MEVTYQYTSWLCICGVRDAIRPDARSGYNVRILSLLLFAVLIAGMRPAIAAQFLPQTGDDSVQVVVELVDQPSARIFVGARHAGAESARRQGQDQTRRIDQAQQRLMPSIARLGGKVLYRAQRTYNGIGLLIPVDQLAALRALSGIRAVHPAVQHHVDYSTNLEEIGAPTAWSGANGGTGTGQKIAIIDTGIDYTHADFGGAGTIEAAQAARANPRVVEPGTGFPSAKVAGGIDLVGDAYTGAGSVEQVTPQPDPDPFDCYTSIGHGTHVAGIAAGLGVTTNGQTFRGPYTASGPSEGLRIDPGVAPGALLYAVKIFGCSGTSSLTPAAIEWAIDPNGDGDFADRMDVINMSLGSTFGSSYDASVVAADNAARAGIVVVTSAGNNGDTYYVTSTPGTADRAISTASSQGLGLSSFSSRGPRRGDNALKPDIAAPGSDIISARFGSGADGSSLSGTSMASPHVAGASAILRERHPSWTVEEIKAALLNTAGPHLQSSVGTPYSPVRAGAGRLSLTRAVNTTAVAFNADDSGRVSISFGTPEVVDSLTLVKNLRVVNKNLDGPPMTYTLGVTPVLTASGVTITPARPSIDVAPGSSATVAILLSIPDGQALGHTLDPTLTAGRLARHTLNEIAGFITLTPVTAGPERLEVGYFAAPRRAALRSVTTPGLVLSESTGTVTMHVSGNSSADPPLTSFFELQHSSTMTDTPRVEAGGVFRLGQAADLQYVGITSDFNRYQDMTRSTLAFALATYTPWAMPSEVIFDIDIDTDRDGATDYTLFTSDTGPAVNSSEPGDTFTVGLRTISGAETPIGRVNFVAPDVDTALYRSRVLTFGVPARLFGLTADKSSFTYRIRTYHIDVFDPEYRLTLIDQTPTLAYDAARPGISVIDHAPIQAGAPIFAADDPTFTLSFNTAALEANGTRGVLLLHHNNIGEQQAQVVPISIDVEMPFTLFLPIAVHDEP